LGVIIAILTFFGYFFVSRQKSDKHKAREMTNKKRNTLQVYGEDTKEGINPKEKYLLSRRGFRQQNL
jgi:hypothetical protein